MGLSFTSAHMVCGGSTQKGLVQMTTISSEEWLAELERLERESQSPDPEWKTREEWQETWQISRNATHERIKEAARLGWLHTKRVKRQRVDGGMSSKPAYMFKRPQEQPPRDGEKR